MKNTIRDYLHSFVMAGFGLWIFAVWRLAGMPAPGSAGYIIPAAWMLAAVLNGKSQQGRWFVPVALTFTVGAWLWMLHPSLWMIAAVVPVAGLIAWGIDVAAKRRYGAIIAVLPLLFLSLITSEINGDEVRFAQRVSALSGISSSRFSDLRMHTGDISLEKGHHTVLFPFLIAPGLLAGDGGIRIVPVIIALLGILLLAKLTNPVIAVIAALLYPGFSIFGLAMTGWLAVVLFTLGVLLPKGGKWSAVKFLIALILVALKMRYAGLAVGILVAEYACMQQKKLVTPLLWISLALLILVVDKYLLEGMIFWARYGNIEAVRLLWINIFHHPLETISHAGWSLFDPEAGLFFRAPWVLAAIPGLFVLNREQPVLFKKLFIPSMLYWAFLVIWTSSSWHGLPAPVGRMFVPMIPLFASGLAAVWSRKETRLFVILSIAVAAIVVASPHCRYNYADGTDSILSLLGGETGFSMVRSGPVKLFSILFLAVYLIKVLQSTGKFKGSVFVIIFTAVLLLSISPGGFEAEDMSPEIVQGARLYPYTSDPIKRYFWFNSRERMLELSESGQSILLPGVEQGDTLLIQMSSSGGVLQAGDAGIVVETSLVEMSSAYRIIRGTTENIPNLPENRLVEVFTVVLSGQDIKNGTVRVMHQSGLPVYVDRMDILKKGVF